MTKRIFVMVDTSTRPAPSCPMEGALRYWHTKVGGHTKGTQSARWAARPPQLAGAMLTGLRTPRERHFRMARLRKTKSALSYCRLLAGAPGLEPGNGGIKIRCLTTWLRPNGRPVGRRSARTIAAGLPPINAPSPRPSLGVDRAADPARTAREHGRRIGLQKSVFGHATLDSSTWGPACRGVPAGPAAVTAELLSTPETRP
jgi:hypothetical protein